MERANLIASCSDYFDRIGLALKQGFAIIENEIDNILKAQRASAAGDENAVDATTLNVAARRLENLIHDRRAAPAEKPVVAAVAREKQEARRCMWCD